MIFITLNVIDIKIHCDDNVLFPDAAAYTLVRMDFFDGQHFAHTTLAAFMSAIIDCFEYDNSPLNIFLHLPAFSHLFYHPPTVIIQQS